jgi:hypothetical protein
MSASSRLLSPYLFLLVLFGIVSVATAQQRLPVRERIAQAYGLASFQQVEQIRYTFNVNLGDKKLSRSWLWAPKTDRVGYEGKDKQGKPVKYTYLRSQVSSQPAEVAQEIDPAFVNDQYWLLFPLHLSWDKDAKVEDMGMYKLPKGRGTARRVLITYPAKGGYTPGDVYELFVAEDNRIREWTYRRGGSLKPTLMATWDDYHMLGPLVVSLSHRGTKDGKPIRIFFTDVALKLLGSNVWVNPQ